MWMMMRIKYLLCFFFLLFSWAVFAQPEDMGCWMGISVRKKLSKPWFVSLTEQVRLKDNMSRLGLAYAEAGTGWRFNDYFRVTAYYRYTLKSMYYDQWSWRCRYYADMDFRLKHEHVECQLRARVERKIRQTIFSEEDILPVHVNRNKLTLSYHMKNIQPYASYEIFIPLSVQGSRPDRERYSAGVTCRLAKKTEGSFFFLFQRSLCPEFDRNYILGVNVDFDL